MSKPSLYIYVLVFFIFNALTLMLFPTVHSDELWLKGISDEMMFQRNFHVTEPFFDLYPRVIHPFRWLFHGFQILFFILFGSSIWSARLLSLFFAALCLIVFDKISKNFIKTRWLQAFCTIGFSLNIQFIYASRFARQETMVLFMMLFLVYYLSDPDQTYKKPYIPALIVLMSMGIHPNSFIVFISGLFILTLLLIQKKIALTYFWQVIAYGGIGTIFYLIIGYLGNDALISSYFAFGAPLGTDAPPSERFVGFYWFWYKLFHQIGGTYDLFLIKWYYFLFIVSFFLGVKHLKKAYFKWVYTLLVAVFFSLLIIGRYNQTSVIFLIPWLYLLSFMEIETFQFSKKYIGLGLVLLISLNTYTNIKTYNRDRFYDLNYAQMIEEIQRYVPENGVILGNLNTIDAFHPHHFYDVRNLAYIDTSIADYMAKRNITHIIWHEEMDYIYRNQNRWGFLYTHTDYMDDLYAFIEQHTEKVHTFENPVYAMRISRYSGTYPFTTTIYTVSPNTYE